MSHSTPKEVMAPRLRTTDLARSSAGLILWSVPLLCVHLLFFNFYFLFFLSSVTPSWPDHLSEQDSSSFSNLPNLISTLEHQKLGLQLQEEFTLGPGATCWSIHETGDISCVTLPPHIHTATTTQSVYTRILFKITSTVFPLAPFSCAWSVGANKND